MKKIALILIASIFGTPLIGTEVVTNPYRKDGFGAQFQSIIFSAIYAEMNNNKYVYTPFKEMDHNYDGDPDFINKKECFINFVGNFEINKDLELQSKQSIQVQQDFFENHVDICAKSKALKKIKELFAVNKEKTNYFSSKHLNIAIHVRRPNSHDTRPEGADIPDGKYLEIIRVLRGIYFLEKPLFHIFSQGNIENFRKVFDSDDIVFHIDESVEDTFSSMVFADVLVTSASSLSYVAGLLSDKVVYYIPFWHPPLPHWVII